MNRAWLLAALAALVACKKKDAPSAAAAPTPVSVGYVHALSIPVREKGAPDAKVVGALPIGAKVTHRSGEWAEVTEAVIGKNKVSGGFVEAKLLLPGPPDYGALWAQTRQLLAEGEVALAAAEAERCAALNPSQRQPWELLAAVYDARHDVENARRVYRALKALKVKPRPPVQVPNPGAPPGAGEVAWVSGTKLRVRADKSTTAPIVGELLINERAQVEEKSGEWAKVKGEGIAGWAALQFLSSAESKADWLLEQASSTPDARVAARYVERAAAVDPGEASTWKALLQAAVRAEEWQLAVSAAFSEVAVGEDGRIVELEQIWGCRGEREHAVVVNGEEHQLPTGLQNVCVTAFSQSRPCPPCFDSYRICGCIGGLEDPQELAAAAKEHAACEADVAADEQAANEAHAAETEGLDAWLAQLSGFQQGPWVRITVRGTPKNSGRRLFVFQKNGDDFQVLEPALDEPSAGHRVVRWVQGAPGITGVVEAKSLDEARANLPDLKRSLQLFDDSNECPPCIKT